jgi:hypothetical protein
MLTFIQVLNLLTMPTAPHTSPNAHQPATPQNTPEPLTQQGSASQRVNGNVENRGQAEVNPSDENLADRAPVLLDHHIPEASAGDWGNMANNASGH